MIDVVRRDPHASNSKSFHEPKQCHSTTVPPRKRKELADRAREVRMTFASKKELDAQGHEKIAAELAKAGVAEDDIDNSTLCTWLLLRSWGK